MQTTRSLAQRNATFLGQALDLLGTLSASAYALRPAQFERGGVGVHMRHVLDHYDAFLDGLQAGRIDYDTRARDEATEDQIDVARSRLRATIVRLRNLGPADGHAAETPDAWVARKLVVIMDLGANGSPFECVSASSVGRELQYLVAHTVHHFALMAVALRACGHKLPDEFGVAPSTLRHEESSSGACAR